MLPSLSLAQLKLSPHLLTLSQTIHHHKKTVLEGLQEVCRGATFNDFHYCNTYWFFFVLNLPSPLQPFSPPQGIFKSKLLQELLPVAVMRLVKKEQQCNNISF